MEMEPSRFAGYRRIAARGRHITLTKLHQDQADYRQRLVDISEERRLWGEQHDLVTATLAEMDENFADALKGPSEIACPTCGHHYHNAIADQFEIVQDKDGLCKRAYYQP